MYGKGGGCWSRELDRPAIRAEGGNEDGWKDNPKWSCYVPSLLRWCGVATIPNWFDRPCLPQPARLYTSALLHAAEKQLGGGKCEPAKKLTDTGREQLDKAGYDFPRDINGAKSALIPYTETAFPRSPHTKHSEASYREIFLTCVNFERQMIPLRRSWTYVHTCTTMNMVE